MMANFRPVLFITLLFLGYLLWVEWQKDYGPAPQPATVTTPAQSQPAGFQQDVPSVGDVPPSEPPGDLPAIEQQPATVVAETQPEMRSESPAVKVLTDVLELEIDPVGGTLVMARLLDYPVVQERPMDKVTLFNRSGDDLFIAQSGLLSKLAAPNHTSEYRTGQREYRLAEGAEELRVPLTWSDGSGIEVTKTFIFKRGGYDIAVRHTLENSSGEAWVGSRYEQLQRAVPLQREKASFTNPGRYSFFGIAFYSPQDKFEKIAFDEVASEPFKKSFSDGWLSMIQHYFFAAWIPPGGETHSYSTQLFSPAGLPRAIARAVSPQVSVGSGDTHVFSSTLYVGPKLQDEIGDIAPGLQHTVNYGIFTVFSKPLFWLLSAIHNFIGNWGWAIILLTVLIKAAFFKLTEAQYKSMARMRKLQPRIEALKERYGDDRQRMSQAMMEMYRQEKVNPLGGCLPILVQIPIFIALYWVLLESVELRQAPFVGWITNLSARVPYFILPILNAAFMIMTQRLTPTAGMDPLQRKMMNAMPVVFSVMFAFFPAGLVLYWATNAGLSLAQQWYITRKIAASD
jgi:YidC/Oxa1 family membrane protein insertase